MEENNQAPAHPLEEQEIKVEGKGQAPATTKKVPVLEVKFQGYDKEVVIEGVPFKVTSVDGMRLQLTRQDINA